MPVLTMENNGFGDTLFYSEGDENGVLDQDNAPTFFHALRKRPGLALIAAKLHDLIVTYYPIRHDRAAVVIINQPDCLGLQLGFENKLKKKERAACLEVIEALEDTARNHKDITRPADKEVEHCFLAAQEQTLLDFVFHFAADNDLDFDRTLIQDEFGGDFAKYHAALKGEKKPNWQADAEEALRTPWIMAALGTRLYLSRHEVLEEAYRTRTLGAYSYAQIQSAIDYSMNKPETRKADSWSHAYH